jgi:hypothetical protein
MENVNRISSTTLQKTRAYIGCDSNSRKFDVYTEYAWDSLILTKRFFVQTYENVPRLWCSGKRVRMVIYCSKTTVMLFPWPTLFVIIVHFSCPLISKGCSLERRPFTYITIIQNFTEKLFLKYWIFEDFCALGRDGVPWKIMLSFLGPWIYLIIFCFVNLGFWSVVGCSICGDAESSGTATREWLIIKKGLRKVGFAKGRCVWLAQYSVQRKFYCQSW